MTAVVRAIGLARAVSGLALLLRPGRMGQVANGGAPPPPAWILRLLGARLLGQGGVELLAPQRPVLLAGAGIDAIHGASMIAAAAYWPKYRRAATASALTAFGFGAAVVAVARVRRQG